MRNDRRAGRAQERVQKLVAGRSLVAVAHASNLTAPTRDEIRAELRAVGADAVTVKNSLARRALTEAGHEQLSTLCRGSTLIAVIARAAAIAPRACVLSTAFPPSLAAAKPSALVQAGDADVATAAALKAIAKRVPQVRTPPRCRHDGCAEMPQCVAVPQRN